jgi:hypothetical protein
LKIERQERAVDKKQNGPAKVAGNDNAAKPKLDEGLEEGLEETFPASDAPAATQPVHHEPHPKKH